MPKKDLHLTIEQLSAYLDGQLAPEEQVHCDAHLKTCEQCQHILADLRLTVRALHSLPQPELPRSFVLPATFVTIDMERDKEPARVPIAQPRTDGRIAPSTPLHRPSKPRHQPWPGFVTGTIRAASTLAAVVGIVFLMSVLLLMVHSGGGSASTTAGSSYPALRPAISPTPTLSGVASPQASDGGGGRMAPHNTPSATPPVPPNGGDLQGNNQDVQTTIFSWLAALDLSTPGGRALSGTLLLALAMAGFLLLRYQRKRTS